MKKIVRLTENDLTRIVKRVLKEQKNLDAELSQNIVNSSNSNKGYNYTGHPQHPSGDKKYYTDKELFKDIKSEKDELKKIKAELEQKIGSTKSIDSYLNGNLIDRIKRKVDYFYEKMDLKQDKKEIEVLKRKLQHAQDALVQHQKGNVINKKDIGKQIITLLKSII